MQIVRALRGHWYGRSGMAHCPAHGDRIPSLAITEQDGRVLVHCHAGCDQAAVVSALHKLGLWPTANYTAEHAEVTAAQRYEANVKGASKDDHAAQTWLAASQAEGTPGEQYLRQRAIIVPVPPSLRFAPRLFHRPTGQYLPAVVAAVRTAVGGVSAIQRVFIRTDGLGKAEVTPVKMCLGRLGDGAVRLAPARETMGLCEGWETGLSAMQLYKLPIWCSLGASRMHRVALPPSVRKIVIFADNDVAGRNAAVRTANVHRLYGRTVEIQLPLMAKDFNEELILADQP